MIRFLRPARIVRSAGATWLVDESWPVAARFAADEPMMLVAWPWPQHQVDPDVTRAVVADGVGIVVGEGGQVIWVRPDGCTVARVDGHLTLAAADPDIAWCAENSATDLGNPPAPPPPLPPGRVVAVRHDGSSTQTDTPAPVYGISVRGADVFVELAEPPLARPQGHGSWSFGYPSRVIRVARDMLLATGLASAVPATGDVPVTGSWSPHSWIWLEDDPDTVRRHGVRAGGLIWWVGALPAGDKIDRQIVAVGHDLTGRAQVRVDLGRGVVGDAQAVGGQLWLTVARRRFLAVPHDRGVEVLTVSAAGAVHTVHGPNSVDISQFAPPLRRPSDDEIRAHFDASRHKFDHLQSYWQSPDGTTSPLSGGLTDSSVQVEGTWPDAFVVITLRHRRRPGLVLRRKLPLFDEAGSPIDLGYADIHLMEDLDTDYLAPADEAVNGVLDT